LSLKQAGAAGHEEAQSYNWDAINQKVVETYLSVLPAQR
jgi:hypothetical protein